MLKGSDKQISWARRIRQDRLASWKKADPLVFKELEPALSAVLSASWWITHREKELREVVMFVDAGQTERKVSAKPSAAKDSPATVSPEYSSLEEVIRFAGETRSVSTGEIVIDPECPF